MSYHIHLNMSIEPQAVTIHNLRIQLPEPLPTPLITSPSDTEVIKEVYTHTTEYVTASPCYTWSEEHARAVKQDQFGEMLWKVIMARYDLEVTPSNTLSLYSAFRCSSMSCKPENFPHHTLQDLMEYYIENTIGTLKKGMSKKEKDNFERHKMLRRMVLGSGIAWYPEYIDVYHTWAQDLPPALSLNRYQKMCRFVKDFFEQHT